MSNRTPQLPLSLGVPTTPSLPKHLAYTQGAIWHVKPSSGVDTNDGKSPRKAFKTLAAALAAATANQNDIVLVYAESNTAGSTTDYQSATLTWNKDAVHIIGVNAGSNIAPRSRVAFTSGYVTASNLFTLSANGCYIANMEFYEGVASANPTGCFNLTGSRNHIENCHIAGIGNDANDIADAYSLRVAGSENVIEKCTIGLDTVGRGSFDNSEISLAGGARNKFIDCEIITYAAANTHQFVKRADGATDRFVLFRNCMFINAIQSAAATMLEAFDIAKAGDNTGGLIYLKDCDAIGVSAWEAASGVSGLVYSNRPVSDAGSGGVAE